jgi:dTDP-glucose 4,6-dehydratase
MRKLKNILVTGGSGFIGSNFIHYLLSGNSGFSGNIINYDIMTYAGNPENLTGLGIFEKSGRYTFIKGDICDKEMVRNVLNQHEIDTIVHFAAESHVDRSIKDPSAFVRTNVMGTFTLLEESRQFWKDRREVLFHHVSTDEVFGSLGPDGFFFEETPYDPQSPYSASKAASDHLVRAYNNTYHLPVTLSNCSNNYGPRQFPEKLIPHMIDNMLAGKPLPIYGKGDNIRDWIHVEDHNKGVWAIMNKGRDGESYNLGGESERTNLDLVKTLCRLTAEATGVDPESYLRLMTFVTDRPGHDHRYAINCDKAKKELGWTIDHDLEQGLLETIRWYLDNRDWVENIKTGDYTNWIEKNYGKRQ